MQITTDTTQTLDIPDNEIKPLIKEIKRLKKIKRITTFVVSPDLSLVTTISMPGMNAYPDSFKVVVNNKRLAKLLNAVSFKDWHPKHIEFPEYQKSLNAATKELQTEINNAKKLANKLAKQYKIDPDDFWYYTLDELTEKTK